jgi:CO/xanthine dehydrogenase FAD-binding subunit
MKPFTYERVTDLRAATAAVVSRTGAKFISGGTNLLGLMKLEIEQPTHLVDISRLPLKRIEDLPDGGIRIGAQAANSEVAGDLRARALSGLGGGTARWCLGPATKQGLRRRQSLAAYAMLVFLRHRGNL